MRNVLLPFFLLFVFRAFSQSNLSKQIRSIVADSTQDFRNYKSSFLNLENKDSVFTSIITIEGTKENYISYGDEMVMYGATIIDSVRLKEGKKVVDNWKNSLQNIFGNSFNFESMKIEEWTVSQYGWRFESGNVFISIDLFPCGLNSKVYFVSLDISRYKFDSFSHKLK
jgi:hypothetical protein